MENYEKDLPILIREDLNDHGTMKFMNHSPDVIVQREKLSNPEKFLRDNYSRDVSDDRSFDRRDNYIYVRCYNDSQHALENIYIHLYRNHLCMYNYPSGWVENKLRTWDGRPAIIPYIAPGEVAVAPVFRYDYVEAGWHPNCFVAVASRKEAPDFSFIDNSDKYVAWVNQKNVAARNVSIQKCIEGYTEWSVTFSNPDSIPANCYIIASIARENAEDGMRYGYRNRELEIDRSVTYREKDQNTFNITHIVQITPGFKSKLTVWTQTTSGKAVTVRITFGKGIPYNSALVKYAISMNDNMKNCFEERMPDMRLVSLGDCTLRSISQ